MCTIVKIRKTHFLNLIMPPCWEAFVRTPGGVRMRNANALDRHDSLKASTTYDNSNFDNRGQGIGAPHYAQM